MHAHVSWRVVLLRINESWMAGDKRILTAARESVSLTAAGDGKNLDCWGWDILVDYCWRIRSLGCIPIFWGFLSWGDLHWGTSDYPVRNWEWAFTLPGEMQDLHLLRDLRTTAGELAFLGDLRGMRVSDDLYWGVQNLIDLCWRSKTESSV